MIGRLGLSTKVISGGFVLAFLVTASFHNGRVFSTTLPRFTYMLAVTLILFVVAVLLVVNDAVAR